jgi:hypothetical protein
MKTRCPDLIRRMALAVSRFFSIYPSTQYSASAITLYPGQYSIWIIKKSEDVMESMIPIPSKTGKDIPDRVYSEVMNMDVLKTRNSILLYNLILLVHRVGMHR